MRFSQTIPGPDLWQWWQTARQQASAHQVDPAEADWLLQAICEVDALALRLGTFRQQAQIPTRWDVDTLSQRWQQRIQQRVPVQYLVGEVNWRDLTLQVTPDVLIPRPETELLIDLAVTAVQNSPDGIGWHQGIWADLGTGSGAIAIGLARAFPQATVLAVDTSSAALQVAQTNAQINGVADRVQFFQGSWFQPLPQFAGRLAAVVSNPPYIPTATVETLQPEVLHHEPRQALDGGSDGLEAIRVLATQGPAFLQTGGLWMVEMMAGQADAVRSLLEAQQVYHDIQICKDLAGIERFAIALC